MEADTKSERKARVGFGQFRELNVFLAFLLLFIFFYSQSPKVFLKPANLAVIMRFIATFGMLSIGEVLIIITGGIDLSVGSLTALTGVIVATLMLKGVAGLQVLGMVPSILIVLCIGVLFGLWHGFFVTKLGIPPFIITLGTWLIARGLASYITRGYPIVFPSENPFLALGQGSLFGIPISFIIPQPYPSWLSYLRRGWQRRGFAPFGCERRSGEAVLLCYQRFHGSNDGHPVGLTPGARHPNGWYGL
jgi:ribose/xylose/arabinose/galactoside ABC-type transport system permease subunit